MADQADLVKLGSAQLNLISLHSTLVRQLPIIEHKNRKAWRSLVETATSIRHATWCWWEDRQTDRQTCSSQYFALLSHEKQQSKLVGHWPLMMMWRQSVNVNWPALMAVTRQRLNIRRRCLVIYPPSQLYIVSVHIHQAISTAFSLQSVNNCRTSYSVILTATSASFHQTNSPYFVKVTTG